MLTILAEYHYIIAFFIAFLLAYLIFRSSYRSVTKYEEWMTIIAKKLDKVDTFSSINYFGFMKIKNGKIIGSYRNRDFICLMNLYTDYGPDITFKLKFNQRNKEPKFMFDYPRPTKHTYAKNGYIVYFLSRSRHEFDENISSSIFEELYEGCTKMETFDNFSGISNK